MKQMRRGRSMTRILQLVCAPVLIGCILLLPGSVLAFQAPPPPNTPTYTVEPPTSTSTFTPEPPTSTFTPEPPTATWTPEPPTATFTPLPPTSTFTPLPPTATLPPQAAPSATAQPGSGSEEEEPSQPGPNPLCQSAVEGYVLDQDGRTVVGARVNIEGSGWSNGIMTDDQGRYGFAGLCAGTATLQAFLASGQAGPVVALTLTGNNSLRQDLGFATSWTAGAVQVTQGTVQPVPTSAVGMPVTGAAGWFLGIGAALGALLLLSAGGRRVLQAYERARSRE